MFQRLPTASLSAAELISGAFEFRVPGYQRAYSWTCEEVGRLLDDLVAAAGVGGADTGEEDYFLGTVLLMDPEGQRVDPVAAAGRAVYPVDIVDGQQRLVTLAMIAAGLRDLDASAENELWSRLDGFLALPGTGRPGQGERRHRIRLHAIDQPVFERFVLAPGASAEMPAVDAAEGVGQHALVAAREHLMGMLSELTTEGRRRLASYICDRAHFVVISTRDVDRAHALFLVLNDRGRPLQRNDILKAEVLNGLVEPEAAEALETWDAARAGLGDGFERLFSHIKTLHGLHRPQVVAAVRTIVSDAGGGYAFVKETLGPFAAGYRRILAAPDPASTLPPSVERQLAYLARLNGEEWVPAALLALRALDEGREGALGMIAGIDRLAHLLRLLVVGNDKRVRRFAAVAAAIRSGEARDGAAPVFAVSRDEMRNITINLRALWRRSPAFSKLMLLRICDGISGGFTDVDPGRLSVEHVLPQRPPALSQWRKHFPDADAREALTQCLGNLVLIPQRQNEAARNQDFAKKQQIYARRDPDLPPLALLDDVLAANQWGPAEIRAREERLLTIASRLLDIDLVAV